MDPKDAAELEKYEKLRHRRALGDRLLDSYGQKQATKKRRKLPGNRKWKDKSIRAKRLQGQFAAEEFNQRPKAEKALENYRIKQLKRHTGKSIK